MHTHRRKIPLIIVSVLFAAWMLPGLFGRDLWKADEPYSFGLVNHIANTGDWVVPTLAGEPFMEKPPLLYVTAAGFVRWGREWLAPPDAARLASALFMALTALFTALLTREFHGKGYGRVGVMILLGSTGLQITAHKLITDVALLTGFSIGLYGLALSVRRPGPGGFWLGIGAGVAFLAKGLVGPGILGLTALLLPLVSPAWRKPSYGRTLLIAFFAALPLVSVWPLALYLRSPRLFIEWFWYQNFGRFFGYAYIGHKNSSFTYFWTLLWFAIPALPLAVVSLRANRGSFRSLPPSALLSLTSLSVMLLVLSLAASIRSLYTIPMLLPLTVLAATAGDHLSDRTRRMLHDFSISFFGLISIALWTLWLMMLIGRPVVIARQLHIVQPDYVPSFNGPLFAVALAYTVVFVFAVVRFTRRHYHPVLTWMAGMTLVWTLLMTIWLPWFNAGSGYDPVFTPLRAAVPASHGVIVSRGVGESERAMLQYYAGVTTRRLEADSDLKDADLFLSESCGNPVDPPAGIKWRLLWERNRPSTGKPKEIFKLYQRVKSAV